MICEPKFKQVLRYVQLARSAGYPAGDVTIVSPCIDQVPGWNPFLAGGPITQIAGDFGAVLEAIAPTSAPRMMNIATNALIVAIAHRQSPYELLKLLQRADSPRATATYRAVTG